MNVFYACLIVSKMLENLQAYDERELIISKGKTSCVSFDNVSLASGFFPRFQAGVVVVFDSNIAGTQRLKFFAKSSAARANFEHTLIFQEPIKHKIITIAVQNHLQSIRTIIHIHSFQCHCFKKFFGNSDSMDE